jgi:hypothetical protein
MVSAHIWTLTLLFVSPLLVSLLVMRRPSGLIDWQGFNQTLGRLAIEVTESAVLGWRPAHWTNARVRDNKQGKERRIWFGSRRLNVSAQQ